jgi:hypothetical protein
VAGSVCLTLVSFPAINLQNSEDISVYLCDRNTRLDEDEKRCGSSEDDACPNAESGPEAVLVKKELEQKGNDNSTETCPCLKEDQ